MISLEIWAISVVGAFIMGVYAAWSILATPNINNAPLCPECRRPKTLKQYPGSTWWARWHCKYCDKKRGTK